MARMLKLDLLLTLLCLLFISGCHFTSTVNQPYPKQAEQLALWKKQQAETKQTTLEHNNKTHKSEPVSYDNSHDDLWKLIASEMTLERYPEHPLVKSKIQWFANNQGYLNRVSNRASPYLFFIVQEIKKQKLPIELALLPIIESAYQPFAKSPSHAAGLWQFIPSTGRRFGLKQNWWYDGRRDIIAATRASLAYLNQIAKRFDNDWELALAGYNVGEHRIERELKKNVRHKRGQTFWDLHLPKETRHYVPSLLAIAEIVAQPEQYDIVLPKINNQPYFDKVSMDSQIDLATVADLSNLSIDQIYVLNPGYNVWATPPDGPHDLLLPLDKINSFKLKLAKLPQDQRVSWKQYTIRRGDSLSLIAAQFGTSVTALKRANKLRSNNIRASHSLLIPTAKRPLNEYTLSADARKYQNLKISNDGKKYIYTVKQGDTLWDISRHYGISVKQLCQWNNISNRSVLRLGKKLNIWIEIEQAPVLTAKEEHVTTLHKNNANTVSYEVQSGDSLWAISQKFGVTVKQLQQWNKLGTKKRLLPGQRLEVRLEDNISGA